MPRTSELHSIAPTFVVADVVRTAEYYRDVLGFELLGYFLDPPVFAMAQRGRVEIHFGKSSTGETICNETVRKGLGTDAYIFVSDIVALFDELTAKGATIVDGPTERPYGRTEIEVLDCDGHKLVFGE
ncbi:MAG: bleomycin resistance protein [Acidobacteria bacterium]|nr:bleomycin resistance protein [Acidobacteriota bacterium]